MQIREQSNEAKQIGNNPRKGLRQGCIYVDSHRNLRLNFSKLRIKRQIDSQLCESKINENMPPKKVNSHEFRRKRRLSDLTLYLNINDLRPFIWTTVTLKMISIKMWYLIQAAVKNVQINLGQLRIKRQIDSQLCDSICAAYVEACHQSHTPPSPPYSSSMQQHNYLHFCPTWQLTSTTLNQHHFCFSIYYTTSQTFSADQMKLVMHFQSRQSFI